MSFDARMVRNVCAQFVTGVTVITAGDSARADGVTVNSFTSVSLDPPLVLFCLHRDSRFRETLDSSAGFAVNFLASWQEPLALAFSARQAGLFDGAAKTASATGVPVVAGALAHLVCRVSNQFDGGDHIIVLGEVVDLYAPRAQQEPLVFFRGTMGALEHSDTLVDPIFDG